MPRYRPMGSTTGRCFLTSRPHLWVFLKKKRAIYHIHRTSRLKTRLSNRKRLGCFGQEGRLSAGDISRKTSRFWNFLGGGIEGAFVIQGREWFCEFGTLLSVLSRSMVSSILCKLALVSVPCVLRGEQDECAVDSPATWKCWRKASTRRSVDASAAWSMRLGSKPLAFRYSPSD